MLKTWPSFVEGAGKKHRDGDQASCVERSKTDSRQNDLVKPQIPDLAWAESWLLSTEGRKMNTVIILIN